MKQIQDLEKLLAVTAKLAVGGLGVLYALGLLVYSLHLSRLGVADFHLLQAQYVLVGLDFIVFLLIPSMVLALFYNWIRKSSAKVVQKIVETMLYSLVALIFIPWLFDNFVAGVWQSPDYLWRLINFWRFFNPLYILIHLVFIDTPVAVIMWKAQTTRASVTLRGENFRAWLLMPTAGIFFSIFAFAWMHFPNIKRSVAGGQPQYVKVAFAKEIEPSKVDELLGRDFDPRSLYILWHEDENWIYLASAHDYSRSMYKTVALDRKLVLGMRLLEAEVVFGGPPWMTPRPIAQHFFVEP